MKAQYDVVVAGAGPAGLAAAVRAAEVGACVAVIDDNPAAGGQIWRGGESDAHDSQSRRWLGSFRNSGISVFTGASVIFGDAAAKTLGFESQDGPHEVSYGSVIIATGARELFLPFPGWTLPGVTGVGGLQALVKCGVDISGRRVVVAGSGPLLLAVAAYLRKSGARVCGIFEQCAAGAIAAFAMRMGVSKLLQAASLQATLAGVPYYTGSWVESAEGDERVERVRIRCKNRSLVEACDYAAVAYGLHPNTELAALLGCHVGVNGVVVNEWQRTSVDGVYCAGECTGIGGVELSVSEGEIAGYAAAGNADRARQKFGVRERAQRFADRLNATFRLRAELKQLPDPSTIVCRCEDVTLERLQRHSSMRSAKLHTRCGMGPCQGRICGTAARFLFGWTDTTVRPPVLPASIGALALHENTNTQEATGWE